MSSAGEKETCRERQDEALHAGGDLLHKVSAAGGKKSCGRRRAATASTPTQMYRRRSTASRHPEPLHVRALRGPPRCTDARSVRYVARTRSVLDRLDRDRSVDDRRRNVVARSRAEYFSPSTRASTRLGASTLVMSITIADPRVVTPRERSECAVIPRKRSESGDPHLGFHAETRTPAKPAENERRSADLNRRSGGSGRIRSSPGRARRAGASLLSTHDFKVFNGPGAEISPPARSDPAVTVSPAVIRVPSLGRQEKSRSINARGSWSYGALDAAP